MDERVASALERAFPDREVETVEDAGPSWNDQNRTVGVEFADGERAYLKIAADGESTRVARERAVIDYVGSHTTIPVPTVIASETDAEVPYLATAPMQGQNRIELWYGDDVDEERRATLARQVGRSLAALHELRFEDHGHVVGGDADGLDLEPGSWTEILVDRVETIRGLACDGRFDHHFDEVIAAVESQRDLLDDAPAALVHGDPAHPNCVHREEAVGFLDWEIAYVGDPARELRRTCRLQFGPLLSRGSDRLVTALHDGYRDRAGSLPDGFEARQPVYDAVSFLGASGYFEKWAPQADEPTEKLAERVRRTMDERLAEVREREK